MVLVNPPVDIGYLKLRMNGSSKIPIEGSDTSLVQNAHTVGLLREKIMEKFGKSIQSLWINV